MAEADTVQVKLFGQPEDGALQQLLNCMQEDSYGVLCADNHIGYDQPIGGAVGYKDHISPAGVGFDIACGNKAVKTNVMVADLESDLPQVMDQIVREVSFGVGRSNKEPVEHEVLDKIGKTSLGVQREMRDLAYHQLGTVGSGNHYVDLFKDSDGSVWIGVHFGSRGFGHKTATYFLQQDPRPKEERLSSPFLIPMDSDLGQAYIEAMELAGEYAYAGRDMVVNKVLQILQAESLYEVHNHHNFAWREQHFDEYLWVVRKGCTPAFPGQQGFVGGSMGDISVILEGIDSPSSQDAMYSTVHGAGRVMSRTQAAGKWKKEKKNGKTVRYRDRSTAKVNWSEVSQTIKDRGIELRGGGADEAPEVYKSLGEVLKLHDGTVKVNEILQPIGVVMAGANEFDPYKD